MCGRFVRFRSWAGLRQTMTLLSPTEGRPDLTASYNVAPTQKVLVAREPEGKREGLVMRWGLIPAWAKDKKMAQINAPADSASEKLMFRSAFKFSGFAYAGNPTDDIATSLSYYCNGDKIVTEDCKDLAELQLKSQAWLDEATDSVCHRKPIVISGAFFSPGTVDGSSPGFHKPTRTAFIHIETFTDVWLPVVRATNEWDMGVDRSMPNTTLARLNGTRLNTALQKLREITLAAGGTWKVDDEFIGALELEMFTETGVNLPDIAKR